MYKFQGYIYASSFDIICMTETWFNSDIADNEVLPKGYNIYRRDRDHRGGGIPGNKQPNYLYMGVDIEAVTIQLSFSIPIFACVLYISPQSSYEYYKKCFKYISNLSNQHMPLIIAGDFNLPDIDWSTLTGGSAVASELCNIIFELNLLQHIDQPTHIQGNVLDLILLGGGDLVHSLKVLPNHKLSYKVIITLLYSTF